MDIRPILLTGNMCDARLWRGDDTAILMVLARHLPLPVFDADLTQDDRIAGIATRTLASATGRLLLIGFSMGAIVAIEMWCQAPERVAGLILLDYNANADLPERAAHRPAQQYAARAGGLERMLIEELLPKYLAAANRADQAMLELIHSMGMALGPQVFVRQSEALRLRADRRAVLGKIDVPVLYGCGLEDILCPPHWHEQWAKATPGAQLTVVARAGHMLPLEAPRCLAQDIDQWLAEMRLA